MIAILHSTDDQLSAYSPYFEKDKVISILCLLLYPPQFSVGGLKDHLVILGIVQMFTCYFAVFGLFINQLFQ
jgi:hypothetical protein